MSTTHLPFPIRFNLKLGLQDGENCDVGRILSEKNQVSEKTSVMCPLIPLLSTNCTETQL